jgi:hypothetical protein
MWRPGVPGRIRLANRSLAVAVQHQLNGCSNKTVLHNGRCPSRRTICRCRHHGGGANNWRLHPAAVCRTHVCHTEFDQRSVLHCRNSEDRPRPPVLQAIRCDPTTRREVSMTGNLKSAAARASAYNDRVEVEFGVLRHSQGDKQRKSVNRSIWRHGPWVSL